MSSLRGCGNIWACDIGRGMRFHDARDVTHRSTPPLCTSVHVTLCHPLQPVILMQDFVLKTPDEVCAIGDVPAKVQKHVRLLLVCAVGACTA